MSGKRSSAGRFLWLPCVMAVICPVLLQAQGIPALISGVVTSGSTGLPVVGAKVWTGNMSTWSVGEGVFSLSVDPPGTYVISASKPGYDPFGSAPLTVVSGGTYTMNIQLLETANPPSGMMASLDPVSQSVHLSWLIPSGPYEILYDDGIPDDFTIWAIQGNMNAVKFTPAAWPVKITGGNIHIGNAANYPPGSNPLVPFQVFVYDASGPGGLPGSPVAGPFDVLPPALGWVPFSISNPPVINAGSFYLVMVQGGNSPNAAGLSVDETTFSQRSYSRFVTGSGPWVPAGGNFLIRATVSGPGGPLMLSDDPDLQVIQGYQVWRLKQGEELNPAVWTLVGSPGGNSLIDSNWSLLPCGPYRWVAKAGYTGNRWSSPAFSNVLGKCWTCGLTVHVTLSCPASEVSGTAVTAKNLVYSDTVYHALLDTTGTAVFPEVWKGTYAVTASRFGYITSSNSLSVVYDTSLTLALMQEKPAPASLAVDAKSLFSTWKEPVYSKDYLKETWGSGNLTANGWTTEGGFNWIVTTVNGNPSPCVIFSSAPQVTNYSQSLVSKMMQGDYAPVLKFSYDLSLDNYGTTTTNQMAIELWDGTTWHTLKSYDNLGGNIPWIHQVLDISSWSGNGIKVRFRAYGGDSYDINEWRLDNIRITGYEDQGVFGECILGYNFYLDNTQCGFVTDTFYTIPSTLVQYGSRYNACVQALFASGTSARSCVNFVSGFLYPPTGLTATPVENSVFLEWKQPAIPPGNTGPPPGLTGYKIFRDSVLIHDVPDPDSLAYYDFNLDPGTYIYMVSAEYDLSSYGYPGQYDESVPSGPVTVNLNYGRPLPFFEPWTQASFAYNDWHFEPEQGNWAISAQKGNPLPDAEFTWSPLKNNYSYSLVSPVLDATNVHCGTVWLDFDYRLTNHNNTGAEKLAVDYYYNNAWQPLTEFSNNSSTGWIYQHLDISSARERSLRIRFRANGVNSLDIISWEIDNIHVYAVCNAPRDLEADAAGYDVNLTWNPPQCALGNNLSEGFEASLFPPENWSQVITDPVSSWIHSGASSPWGVHTGNFSAGVAWDYNHQDEWLIAHDIEITGDLVFWSYAYQGSPHLDHYYVKISVNQGTSWIPLLDLSALPPYPSPNGYNQWNQPYTIDMTAYLGMVADIAWQAVDGDGLGLWHHWAVDDCMVGDKKIGLVSTGDSILGYDIFRQDNGSGSFLKINPSVVAATSYTDHNLPAGSYNYFVRVSSDECSVAASSDTVSVDVITGLNVNRSDRIRVFPVPASSTVHISSGSVLEQVGITDCRGNIVRSLENIGIQDVDLDVKELPAGFYFIRIISAGQTEIKKLVITH